MALTISLLGCAGTQLTPRLTRGAESSGEALAGFPAGSPGANPIATLTFHF